MVFPMFIIIVVMASFSLIVIIHNSFAVSMNARVHHSDKSKAERKVAMIIEKLEERLFLI